MRARGWGRVIGCAWLVFFMASACTMDDRKVRPNVILISLDTVRADHFGSYGHDRDTTPNLDAFVSRATRYANAFSPGPWTYTSHVEMLTGQIPQEIGVYTSGVKVGESVPIFSEHLKAAGYQLAAFVDSRKKGYVGGKRGFGRGFDVYSHAPHRAEMATKFEFDARVTFEEGLAWVASREDPSLPFGLFLHTKTAHKIKEIWAHEPERSPPYDVPIDRFRFVKPEHQSLSWQDPELGRGGELLGELNVAYRRGERDPADFDREHLEALVTLYDSALHYIDAGIGDFIAALHDTDLYDDSLIIITSDHGEEFLEHGRFNHKQLFQETTRIPLIVKFPRDDRGRIVERNVRLADIVPTILSHAGVEVPDALGGVVLDGRDESVAIDRPIYGAHYKERSVNSDKTQHLSLRLGEWTLVIRSDSAEKNVRRELFHRATDPDERMPVVDQPERLARMEAQLSAWHRSWMPRRETDLELDDETRKHLRALGYAE